MPAKAGTQFYTEFWFPAFAGMTTIAALFCSSENNPTALLNSFRKFLP